MFNFGADYYPEQWAQWLPEGEARWEIDAQLMEEAGLNTVRLAEFAWGLLEPSQDYFDFGWLERAIGVLERHGIRVVLCTPTPTPPPWLLHAHPDITQITKDERRQGPGTRREACANHPVYQERSRIICEALAKHFGNHPNVIGWQTDNEFGCHDSTECYCEYCEAAFHQWLRDRYGDLETLNEAWGGAFWGEVYADWTHIPVPTQSAAERSPSHLLDYHRFSSDSWVTYQETQLEILRQHAPGRWITHNLMGFFKDLDYYDLGANLDFVSWDNYHYYGATTALVAAAHDLMYGIKRRPFWVMEQQVGQINWSQVNPLPPPNFVRLKTWQGIAHGADGMIYFRWRQAIAGSEQYHSGLLDHAGRRTMGYYEAQGIAAELKRIAPVLEGTRPKAEVAILVDYESRWVLEMQPHNKFVRESVPMAHVSDSPALRAERDERREPQQLMGQAHGAWEYIAPYASLWEMNVPAALTSPEFDLSEYKVVIAPFLNVMRPEVAANLKKYVEQGGTLIVGPRTGIKDGGNRLFTSPQPGPLAELTGATVEMIDSMEPDRLGTLRWDGVNPAHRTEVALWAEILDPGDAEVIAWYGSGWYSNRAAITRKAHTAGGSVIMVGCMGSNDLYDNLLGWLLPQVDVKPLLAPLAGVETGLRVADDGRRIHFILNHTAQSHSVSLMQPIHDLIAEEVYERSLLLRPGQIVVYEVKA